VYVHSRYCDTHMERVDPVGEGGGVSYFILILIFIVFWGLIFVFWGLIFVVFWGRNIRYCDTHGKS